MSLKEDDTIRHQTWKIQAALGGCLSDPPSLSAPFHLRILHKYSLGVFLPLSGPILNLPALTVVHESEGCRLSSVCGALEEADGLAYPSPSLPVSSAQLLSISLSTPQDSFSLPGRKTHLLLLLLMPLLLSPVSWLHLISFSVHWNFLALPVCLAFWGDTKEK